MDKLDQILDYTENNGSETGDEEKVEEHGKQFRHFLECPNTNVVIIFKLPWAAKYVML